LWQNTFFKILIEKWPNVTQKIIVGLIGHNFEAWVPKFSKNTQTFLDLKYALVEVFLLVYILCKAVDLCLDVCDAHMGYVFHKHTAAAL
jgi:hypothetical protein